MKSEHDTLRFDPVEHRYWFGNIELPSVTTALDECITDLSMVDPDVLERARVLGDYVHKATALDDQGILDVDTLDPALVPYVEGWRKFRRDMRYTPILTEERVHSLKYGYAGTLDSLGYFDTNESGPFALIDKKRVDTLYPSVGPQTAAYEKAIDFGKLTNKSWGSLAVTAPGLLVKRYAVQLFDTGKYKLTALNDPSDFSTFLSCLQIYNFKRRHGIRIRKG